MQKTPPLCYGFPPVEKGNSVTMDYTQSGNPSSGILDGLCRGNRQLCEREHQFNVEIHNVCVCLCLWVCDLNVWTFECVCMCVCALNCNRMQLVNGHSLGHFNKRRQPWISFSPPATQHWHPTLVALIPHCVPTLAPGFLLGPTSAHKSTLAVSQWPQVVFSLLLADFSVCFRCVTV